ncbi:MAG: glutamate-1-semialdehyde 2,1-aminomutase [Bacteroidetes bacterium]|nr:glutamate-1-semialdehyde 2,1-aminomutase [Bacteroidota bacterium]
MNFNKSTAAYQEALECIPGGVNSPVRAFKSVDNDPVFIEKALGSKVYDIDGNDFIDYVASWGPMILGHARPEVIQAVQKMAVSGTSFGAPTLLETRMAHLIIEMVSSIESVRMVNSGTEATMSALRLARGYTGRNLVVKFEGCYHGHGDSFLIKAGSGALTFGTPNSPGVTPETAKNTLTASFNDLNSVEQLFNQYGNDIAAVILEPVTGNMGVVVPDEGFLKGLRMLCNQYNSVLIFDEVMTGFRLARGGAQEVLGIDPDLTTLGKIIGGGLPVGAFGGKKEIMEMLSPTGPVYQAGTLSGNPLAMIAGYTTLSILNNQPDIYIELEKISQRLEEGINYNLKKLNFPAVFNRIGSMFTLFFTDQAAVKSFNDVLTSDTNKFARYFNETLQDGIYIAPSQFEAGFVSSAHTEKDIQYTIEKNYEALKKLL